MKKSFQLAYKNLIGAGLRTWLNVIILSFSFVLIIFYNGMIDGWNNQAKKDTIAWEYGQGHLRYDQYDPLDPFSIKDGHGVLPGEIPNGLCPVLLVQGSVFPENRLVPTTLKGIDIERNRTLIPTHTMKRSDADIPAAIGSKMAKSLNAEIGEQLLIRWRDGNGTFDASSITIVEIFDNDVPSVDNGQIWIPLKRLQEMTVLPDHATYFISSNADFNEELPGWTFIEKSTLTAQLDAIINSKKSSGKIMFILLLGIALLALFDTQVLSIFRRQKEIGTYISLGMTRREVVALFTVEGLMHSVFAAILALLYGTPLFLYFSKNGIEIPAASADSGIAIQDVIYPIYSLGLILSTIAIVFVSAAIVSFIPSRKIAKMNPVDALKGKIQ